MQAMDTSNPVPVVSNVPQPQVAVNSPVGAAGAALVNPAIVNPAVTCQCTTTTTAGVQTTISNNSIPNPACAANVVTIPVPIVQNEENYAYVTVKGSLHDRSCAVFGLNDTEVQALSKRFENGVKGIVNGVMVSAPPMVMLNTLAQLSYKVVCSCGEAEICWTMQREI